MRIALLATLAICTPAAAHDFFLAPSANRVAVGERATVVMRVGSELEMEELPRSNRRIVRFEAHLGDTVTPVEGKHGASPAGRLVFDRPGVATIVYQSSHTDLELDGPKFEHYLTEEGLEDIAAQRAKLGVTASPGRESYARYAKALVTVGDGDAGWDRRVGLAAELVALGDPRAGGNVQFQLFYEDKPQPSARVDILRVEKTKLVSVGHGRTDAAGKVTLAIPGDGVWLAGTTLMRAAPPELGLEGDWESFWVSLAFETRTAPAKKSRGCATGEPGIALALLVLASARRRSRRRET